MRFTNPTIKIWNKPKIVKQSSEIGGKFKNLQLNSDQFALQQQINIE